MLQGMRRSRRGLQSMNRPCPSDLPNRQLCASIACYSTSTLRKHVASTPSRRAASSSSSSSITSYFDTDNLTRSAKQFVNKATELFDLNYRRSIEKTIAKTMPKKSMVPIEDRKLLLDMIYACTFSMNIYDYHDTFVQQCRKYASTYDEAKKSNAIIKEGDRDGAGEVFSNDSLVLMNILPGKKDKKGKDQDDTSLCCAYFIRPQPTTANTDANVDTTAADVHQGDGTLWIVCRGTANAMDMITDATWMIKTEPIQDTNLHVAFLVGKRCNQIIVKLQPTIELLRDEYGCDIKRIGFVGHSLGGAVATSLYTYYMMTEAIPTAKKLPAITITVGAPLTYHRLIPFEKTTMMRKLFSGRFGALGQKLASIGSGPSDKEEAALEATGLNMQQHMHDHIHNIIHNLDIVPRFVGAHKFPKYLNEGEIGKMLNGVMRVATVNREEYRTFGHYYSLRNPVTFDQIKEGFLNFTKNKEKDKILVNNDEEDDEVEEKKKKTEKRPLFSFGEKDKSGVLVEVNDPPLFLSIFPDNLAEFAFSVTDHSIDKSVEDIHNVEIKGSSDVFAYLKEKLNFSRLF